MLSIPDMALLGAAALLLFGPEQLPRVLRKVGTFTREVQNTSQSFIREMERAADVQDAQAEQHAATAGTTADLNGAYVDRTHDDLLTPTYEPLPHEFGDVGFNEPRPHVEEPDVAPPDPEPPMVHAVEKLAEPRPALSLETPPAPADPIPPPADAPTMPMAAVRISPAAEPPPEGDHTPHV